MFQIHNMHIVINISMISHDKIFRKKLIYEKKETILVVHAHRSSVEMLNGYMIRERLGTKALSTIANGFRRVCW